MTKDTLILKMLRTLWTLGNSPTARIDARVWFEYYLKKAMNAGVKPRKRSVVSRKHRALRR